MLDIAAETTSDLRPALAVCAYDLDQPAWPVEEEPNLAFPFARAVVVEPAAPEGLAQRLSEGLRERRCQGLLLVGRSRSGQVRLQTRAENRVMGGKGRLDPLGPAVARATASAQEILRALGDVGVTASATSDAEDDAGSYLLYRVLNSLPDGADAPAVGLLRLPHGQPSEEAARVVSAVASAMARHLPPCPRTRT